MTEPGGSRPEGRHSSGDDAVGGFPGGAPWPGFRAPHYEPARYDPSRFEVPEPRRTGALPRTPTADAAERVTGGFRRPGLLDLPLDRTGPVVEPAWWSHGCSDDPTPALTARHGRDGRSGGWETDAPQHSSSTHPSAPLPPMPSGTWSRMSARPGGSDDATVAQPVLRGTPPPPPDAPGPGDVPGHDAHADDAETDAHHLDPRAWEDQTGGLEVIGAHVEDDGPRRGRRRRSRHAAPETAEEQQADERYADEHLADEHLADEHLADAGAPVDTPPHHGRHEAADEAPAVDPVDDDEIPVEPYDHRRARARRRRRPVAVLLSLLVLAGLVFGIVVGGQRLLDVIDPSSRDYTGQGSGSVEIRVRSGDTLSDIARTLVDAGVIASVGPFVDAAEANTASMGIQPGVYGLRQEMSGQSALDLLLDPAARLLTRVTVPEGLTLQATLTRLAESTGTPLDQWQAAAADPAALGLPGYANGQLEGFLFPATYDVEPGTEPAAVLRQMLAQFVQMAGRVQLEQRAAALGLSPYQVVTVASMIESETRLDAERPDVAQVIYNRLNRNIPLGIDATLAYGLGKSGNDLTRADLQTDGPYNTRTRVGLPPTPISAPGEESLEAALAPSSGDLLYYVLESEDGTHFFTSDYAEFEQARQRCAEAGLGCGG